MVRTKAYGSYNEERPLWLLFEVKSAMSALSPSNSPSQSSPASVTTESVDDPKPSVSTLKKRLRGAEELAFEYVDDKPAGDEAALAQGESAAIESQEGSAAQSEPTDPTEPTEFDAKAFLKTVPNRPGCYRMYNDREVVIYVGKAKDLKRRLSSYFLKQGHELKTRLLVAHIAHIEFTVTFSESEALILENEPH